MDFHEKLHTFLQSPVFDELYLKCSLQYSHKSRVIVVKEGKVSDCIKKIENDWKL